MDPFERWDDWEWERAIQEVGKERGRGKSSPLMKAQTRRPRNTEKPASRFFLDHWNGSQKRTLMAAFLFLMVYFSANSSDVFSEQIHSLYSSAMASGDYYASLNGMAKEAISLGGVGTTSVPVDSTKIGQFLPPISGQVVAGFGEVGEGGTNEVGTVHEGIDVLSALGVSVVSPAGGIVTFVGEDSQLGKIVKVDFGDGWTTVLGNLGEISVVKGQQVTKGKVLGTVGLSAPLKKPWLHFELRKDNKPVNPLPYLSSQKS